MGAITSNPIFTKKNSVDWIANNSWSHFAGSTLVDDGVFITPTNRVITHNDTSPAQSNPPINVRGSHAEVTGDFEIKTELKDITDSAIIHFYGSIPVIYDEWRAERGSVRIEVSKNSLEAKVWDGSAANAIDIRNYMIDSSESKNISLLHKAEELHFYADQLYLGSMPDHDIFDSGKIWFGAEANHTSSGWKLSRLQIEALNTGQVSVVTESPVFEKSYTTENSLRSLTENHPRKLPIGAAVSVYPLFTDEKYRNIALNQFSMLTPENSMKPQAIHPKKDLYLFQDSDSIVEAAEAHGIKVHGHALVMGKANPEWMYTSADNEREAILVDHVRTIMDRYKGRIAQWDVVNEPIALDDIDFENGGVGLRRHMWLDGMGELYIDIALKTAREADPKAKLYINDFGMENDGKRWDALIALIGRLQSREVPLDGIGFEAHVYHEPADTINPESLRRHIQQLAAMGLESRISEIDVLGNDPGFQTQQYSDLLTVCLTEPTCTSYTTWGITDLYGSTALSDRYPIIYGSSLLWDTNFAPKPAYFALQAALGKK